ncbi:MAG: GNAT family N-acetyltransferase [Acetatifactor sp.]|nr:GNAT family N-acetyltransferase [Acetatifactor sp.]
MNISNLSRKYEVREIKEEEILAVYDLCCENPQYYHYCPPEVTMESIKFDMTALPPGKEKEDKYYIGFWDKGELVAVMDLITGYPNEDTVYIGFFMMNAGLQGKGIGTQIIEELCKELGNTHKTVQLGYVRNNPQAESFWIKNNFLATGHTVKTESYEIVEMQRML